MTDPEPLKPDEIELGGMLLWQGMPREELEDKILTLVELKGLTEAEAATILGLTMPELKKARESRIEDQESRGLTHWDEVNAGRSHGDEKCPMCKSGFDLK
jgi:hypothetical protein